MAAITILAAEAPHYIRQMFATDTAQENGKYIVNVHSNGKLKMIALDDYFPCFVFTVYQSLNAIEKSNMLSSASR